MYNLCKWLVSRKNIYESYKEVLLKKCNSKYKIWKWVILYILNVILLKFQTFFCFMKLLWSFNILWFVTLIEDVALMCSYYWCFVCFGYGIDNKLKSFYISMTHLCGVDVLLPVIILSHCHCNLFYELSIHVWSRVVKCMSRFSVLNCI